MRQLASRLIGFAALSCALAGAAAGCRSAVEDFYDPLTTGGSSTGGGGTGGGLPTDCQGDPTTTPAIVRDECGVFVDAATATNGDGTKASPFKSIAEAAAKGSARVFVCAGDYTETATIELTGGAEVYGGFGACPKAGDWKWDATKRASVTGPKDKPTAHVTMGTSLIRSTNLTAPDATTPGASSIALIADSADLTLTDVDLKAGAGADGADGMVPDGDATPGVSAENTATPACNATQVAGKGATLTCTDGPTTGGDGGKGGTVPANNGEAGTDGDPIPDPNPDGFGLGGQPTGVALTCNGHPGQDGDPGAAGDGGTGKGTLTASGLTGGDGQDGKLGARGHGGGGGAGAKAGSFCPPAGSPTPGPGASGGGGGSGGCGGKGGPGGKAGGSSVGLVSLASKLVFTSVKITAGAGAKGGNGAIGKGGAAGGNGVGGGTASGIGASKAGCSGGPGGAGGGGGTGGGGRGGHSIGIAFLGDAPTIDKQVTIAIGAPGKGGTGDAASMGDGDPGTAAPTVDFK
jgi:hypothetical protein